MNYKPLEVATKLIKLFEKEFDKITFYNLMFYSDMARDLLNVFKDKDS